MVQNVAFDAHVLLVLIASPGDTLEERDAAERALHGWNASRAEREQIVLLPRRWENSAVPRLGGRAQSIINEDLVDKSDIVIALFDSRLGMATGEAVSGTAEEIQRAHEAGKPVHVWFSHEPLPRDANLEQVAALREFKATLQPLGLLGSYASPDDLVFQVRQAIESDLARLELGPIAHRKPVTGAVLRARYDYDREPHTDNRGKTKYRTRRERITVENIGAAAAADVTLKIEPLGEGEAPNVWTDESPTIAPNSSFAWSLLTSASNSRSVRVTFAWNEDGAEHSDTQDLALA